MKKTLAIWLLLLACPLILIAQSRPSAYGRHSSIQAGAEVSSFNPDFYCASSSPFTCGQNGRNLLKGIGVFADYNVGTRLGAEGEARWLHWDGTAGQTETTYLVGPRYRVYTWRSFEFWAKFMVGRGSITLPAFPGSSKGGQIVYAPGFSADYKLSRNLSLRGDYEFQMWPNFSSGVAPHNHGLAPNGFSIGVSYNVFRR